MSADRSHQLTSAEGSLSDANAKLGRGTTASLNFLAGGGEMGALMRTKSWDGTALGPPETWPDALKMLVSICLNSRFPISLWWGPDLIMLYNDAWRPILGRTEHPASLARLGIECWPEIWDTIGSQLNSVLNSGEATWSDDLMLVVERNSYREEAYFTYSYGPIKTSDNRIGGVFSALNETTERVLGERRLRVLRDLAERLDREGCEPFLERDALLETTPSEYGVASCSGGRDRNRLSRPRGVPW